MAILSLVGARAHREEPVVAFSSARTTWTAARDGFPLRDGGWSDTVAAK